MNHAPVVRPARRVLDADSFESLTQHIHELLCLGLDHIVVDLTGVTWVYPVAAIELVMLSKFLHCQRRCTPVIKLEAGAAYSYLQSRGVLDLLRETAELIHPRGRRSHFAYRDKRISEEEPAKRMILISDGSIIKSLVKSVVRYLQRRDGLYFSEAYAFDVCIVLSELLHNVLDHNPPDTFAMFLMELYRRGTESLLTIAIGDIGVGIMTSLRRNPRYGSLATDAQAISTAIQFGSTEFAGTNRGNGLFFSLKTLSTRGGLGDLRSGNGRLQFRPNHSRRRITEVSFLPGTVFSVSLPGVRQLTIGQLERTP